MPNNLLHLRGDGESYVASFVGSRGYKSVYVPSASIYHFVPKERMTVDYFRKRAFNQGVSDSFTQLRTNESLKSSAVSVHPLQKLVSNQISRKIFRYLLPPGIFLRANINDSYLSALRWHRNLFANDQTVHDWVLKETYMDNQ